VSHISRKGTTLNARDVKLFAQLQRAGIIPSAAHSHLGDLSYTAAAMYGAKMRQAVASADRVNGIHTLAAALRASQHRAIVVLYKREQFLQLRAAMGLPQSHGQLRTGYHGLATSR
jgi:hypothetical protein